MKISVLKQILTPEEYSAHEVGESKAIQQYDFETIAQAQRYFYNIQQKYGPIAKEELFDPTQGNAVFYTRPQKSDTKVIIYKYSLEDFKGELLKMMNNKISSISRRDTREASIDYNKSLGRDALALESLAKRLHEYLSSGQMDFSQVINLKNQIMDTANDLNEVASQLEGDREDDLAGLGAGASFNVGLNKKASIECPHCGYECTDAMQLTEHENEKHLGQRPPRRPSWNMNISDVRDLRPRGQRPGDYKIEHDNFD